MAHSGWAKVLTKAGYVIQHEHSTRGTFGDKDAVRTIILKDGAEVLRLEQNWNNKGGATLSAIYRKCCEDLGIVKPRRYCAEGPIELGIEETDAGFEKQIRFSHPSFGEVSINRYQGGRKLFMSPIDTQGGMTIRISSADLIHSDNGTDRVYGGTKVLAEVSLSFTQFAEVLTSGGTPVPCTIRYIDGIDVDPFPEMPTALERLENTMEKGMKDAVADLSAVLHELDAEMQGPGGLSPTRKREVWARIRTGLKHLEVKPSWLMKMWKENTQTILVHAKGEFVAWAEQARRTKGHALEGLEPDTKSLEQGEKE